MNIIQHYDQLVEEGNGPFRDPSMMKAYMDKWDGQLFVDLLHLEDDKSVLEIGVGTGRLAAKVASHCRIFYGIDISPKTIERAKENLCHFRNIHLITDDFMTHHFNAKFDIIYASLTSMHFKDKAQFIVKISNLLNERGRFVLAIDKNTSPYIDMGTYKLEIYPDTVVGIQSCLALADMAFYQYEVEFAYIFECKKKVR